MQRHRSRHMSRGPQTPKMTREQMLEIINKAQPGDRLKLTFANKPADENLKGELYFILAMSLPDNSAIQMGEMAYLTLQAVADSGDWCGCYTYTVTVLEGFDCEYFAQRTVGHNLLHSIEREPKRDQPEDTSPKSL